MTEYTVTVDRTACDGVFACLVRDDRFVEDDDGLAGFDTDAAVAVEGSEDAVSATFDDDRLDDAQMAAGACPLDAISVERGGTEAQGTGEGSGTEAQP